MMRWGRELGKKVGELLKIREGDGVGTAGDLVI